MHKVKFILFGLLISFLSFSQIAAQNKLDTQANVQKFVKKYADKLEARYKGKSVGYAFVVRYRNNFSEARAGGDARRPPDADTRKMTVDDKFNIASVNKTITAAAVIKLVKEKQPKTRQIGINLDIPMYQYLPPDWVIGPGIKRITIRQLLTHKSDIDCRGVDYGEMKKCIEDGINPRLKLNCGQSPSLQYSEKCYRNANYALFRYIIPHLARKNLKYDTNPALEYAKAYNDYVNQLIFAPIGLNNIDTKPTDVNPALAYQYPAPVIAGTDFGDTTLTNALSGFRMSAAELSTFVSSLMFTGDIFHASVAEQMKTQGLGLFLETHSPTLSESGHAGHLPGKDKDGKIYYNGEMNTMIVTYSNGVSLSLIVNSQFGPKQDTWGNARDAMLEMINNK